MFCPKCGSLLQIRDAENDNNEQYCSCGFVKTTKEEVSLKEEIKHKNQNIIVHDQINPLANYEHTCSRCNYEKGQIVQQVLLNCDPGMSCEANKTDTICGKCGFKERLK